MNRIYHPYTLWEDHESGMYTATCFMDNHRMITECEVLLKCPEWLYESMSFVTHGWFYSSEHNLTNVNRNRQAWLGQAACCLTHGAPEYLTKLAWHNLSKQEQDAANKIADEVIEVWVEKHQRGYFAWEKLNSLKMCSRHRENESLSPSTTSSEST